MCQKAFGVLGRGAHFASGDGFAWTRGKPSEFRSSAIVARGFCAACGTPLYMREDGDVNYEIAIGTLDKPDGIPPMTEQVGIESEFSWFSAMHGLPRQTTEDDRSPEDLVRLREPPASRPRHEGVAAMTPEPLPPAAANAARCATRSMPSPFNPHICHCRMCQKAAATSSQPFAAVELLRFRVDEGNPGIFQHSAAVERGFCRNCGTP